MVSIGGYDPNCGSSQLLGVFDLSHLDSDGYLGLGWGDHHGISQHVIDIPRSPGY